MVGNNVMRTLKIEYWRLKWDNFPIIIKIGEKYGADL